MKTKQTRKEVRVIDIPNELFTKLVNDSKQNFRSYSKQIIYILKKHYESRIN